MDPCMTFSAGQTVVALLFGSLMTLPIVVLPVVASFFLPERLQWLRDLRVWRYIAFAVWAWLVFVHLNDTRYWMRCTECPAQCKAGQSLWDKPSRGGF